MNDATSTTATRLRQLICIIYFFGGLAGLYVLLPGIKLFFYSFLTITLFSLLILQNIIAVYGSVLYWKNNTKAGVWLYWLSWSSVPVFTSSMISYHSVIGLGVAPVLRFVPGDYGFDLFFRFGYSSALKWFPTSDIFQLGFNVVPFLFIIILGQLLADKK